MKSLYDLEFFSSIKKTLLIYVGFAISWFLFVDFLLSKLSIDVTGIHNLNFIQDGLFIIISVSLLFVLLRHCTAKHAEKISALRQNEECLVYVLEGSQLGFWDWDIETGKVKRNAIWAEMLGYSYGDIQFSTQQWTDFVHPEDRARAWDSISAVLDGRADEHKMIYRMKTREGDYKWILDQARVVRRDIDGKPLRMSGTHTDLSELKQAEYALHASEQRFQSIFETAAVGISQIDLKGRFQLINDTFCHIIGYSREEILTHKLTFQDITYPDDLALDLQLLEQLVQEIITDYQLEKRYIRKDGEIVWVKLSVAPLRDLNHQQIGFISAVQDITQLKSLQHELELQAHIDYLTSIPNRRHFLELAEYERARTQRYSNDLAIFMIDIDHFKKINDDYGHKAGDIVLQKTVQVMQSTLREVDVLGRMGGEEFALLLPQTNKQRAMEVASRLLTQVAENRVVLTDDKVVNITLSIGVAVFKRQNDIDTLLQQADFGLYQAKSSGRNTVVFSE